VRGGPQPDALRNRKGSETRAARWRSRLLTGEPHGFPVSPLSFASASDADRLVVVAERALEGNWRVLERVGANAL
jgi:hypothetical protein